MDYVAIGGIALVGCFLQSACGIGYAMLFMGLAPLIIPFKVASVLEVLTAFAFVLYLAIRLRRHIRPRLIVWPLIASTITSTLGVALLSVAGDAWLRRAVGVALLLAAAVFFGFSARHKLRATPLSGLIVGAISGFTGGLVNIGGPPMAIYLLAVADTKEEYNASIQCYFVLTTVYIFAMHLLHGNVTAQVWQYSIPAFAGVALGSYFGLKMFHRLPVARIKQGVYLLMAVIGVMLVIRG